MGPHYLIDTNTVIDYLMGKLPPTGMAFMNGIINDIPNVSIITKIEVLGFSTTPFAYKILTDFFDDAIVFGLTDEVTAKTIELRKTQKIKLPDSIIAATALVNNFTLISRNTADFKSVPGLTIIDPHTK